LRSLRWTMERQRSRRRRGGLMAAQSPQTLNKNALFTHKGFLEGPNEVIKRSGWAESEGWMVGCWLGWRGVFRLQGTRRSLVAGKRRGTVDRWYVHLKICAFKKQGRPGNSMGEDGHTFEDRWYVHLTSERTKSRGAAERQSMCARVHCGRVQCCSMGGCKAGGPSRAAARVVEGGAE
jgi:hypothetical protein